MSAKIEIQPGLNTLRQLIAENNDDSINMYPVYTYLPSLELTPHMAYLKLTDLNDPNRKESFLLEGAKSNDELDRFSFIGFSPRKVVKTGPTEGLEKDPLLILQDEMGKTRLAENVPGLPPLSGGAIGYISYDCVRYFEPRTRRPLRDVLKLPEAYFMLCDTIVAYDYVFQRFQIIHNINLRETPLEQGFELARKAIADIYDKLTDPLTYPVRHPNQPPIKLGQTFTSNIGEQGYKNYVSILKEHIRNGDIIQAVPSQRVSRPTSLHPFNIYQHLRTVNPSPYLFYIDCLDFQIIGASPELLCKSNHENRVITHPIAGTVPTGTNQQGGRRVGKTTVRLAQGQSRARDASRSSTERH